MSRCHCMSASHGPDCPLLDDRDYEVALDRAYEEHTRASRGDVIAHTTLPRWGELEVWGSVRLGRAAPLATSEATFLDGGDGSEVEITHALRFESGRVDRIDAASFAEDELGRLRVAALEQAVAS